MFYPFLEVKIDILNVFGGIFVIQLTSDGGSLQGLIYSTFTFICVYNLATFCSNIWIIFINIYILRNMWMFLVFYPLAADWRFMGG